MKELIRRAGLSINEYKARFKDLTAEEEQKVEKYDSQGKLKRQRRMRQTWSPISSQLDPSTTVEYRDVKSVEGVAIKKREARLVSLLNRSAIADSVKKELDRINHESRRYDLAYSVYGERPLTRGYRLIERTRVF